MKDKSLSNRDYNYLNDWEKGEESKFQVNDLPVSSKVTTGTTELPSISETFHSGYDNYFKY